MDNGICMLFCELTKKNSVHNLHWLQDTDKIAKKFSFAGKSIQPWTASTMTPIRGPKDTLCAMMQS